MTTIRIEQEIDAESPRDDEGNIGVMVAFHGRYKLGDDNHGFSTKDFSGWSDMMDTISRTKDVAVMLPLFLYDHSGITIRTTPFDCKWDSGQVGYIYATKAAVREAFGVKRIDHKVRARVSASLKAEVEVYDAYLTGDVYCAVITDDKGETEYVGPFYGSDPFTNGMAESIPAELHDALKAAADA